MINRVDRHRRPLKNRWHPKFDLTDREHLASQAGAAGAPNQPGKARPVRTRILLEPKPWSTARRIPSSGGQGGGGENRIRGLLASTRAGGSGAELRTASELRRRLPLRLRVYLWLHRGGVCVSAISYSTVLSDACYPLALARGIKREQASLRKAARARHGQHAG